LKISYSFRIKFSLMYSFLTRVRKLFKGGNYSRKYGSSNSKRAGHHCEDGTNIQDRTCTTNTERREKAFKKECLSSLHSGI
jgi:hypothetical protein